jgi:predicted GNAT family acetyltransferase
MKEAQPEELINIFINNLDYVLELSVLQEPQLCVKPVHKFERAFTDGEAFCMIYSEADDPENIFASYNSRYFEKIFGEYNISKTIFHDENGDCESFYYNKKNLENIKYINIRLLAAEDKKLTESKEYDYLNIIFIDFIKSKIWKDCGIIGAFDEYNNFTGYLAYYELAENIRDVSYIYIKKEFRKSGRAKDLLNYFKNKNIQENKISYYSYAADEASAKLAESCGFLPCAKRFEK